MVRALFVTAGLVSLALGLLGLLLPLLPTTPFLLLAAGCFSRGSSRMHGWLLRLPLVGRLLEDYARLGGLTRRTKRAAVIFLWLTMGASVVALSASTGLMMLLAVIAVAVSLVIVALPNAASGTKSHTESLRDSFVV